MNKAREFFKIIKDNLRVIPEQYSKADELYGGARTQLHKEQYDGIRSLYLRLDEMYLCVQTCISNTHGMVISIVSIFVES